ncbi:hypothetical protein ACLOJK_027905 [Asimina triloba]
MLSFLHLLTVLMTLPPSDNLALGKGNEETVDHFGVLWVDAFCSFGKCLAFEALLTVCWHVWGMDHMSHLDIGFFISFDEEILHISGSLVPANTGSGAIFDS